MNFSQAIPQSDFYHFQYCAVICLAHTTALPSTAKLKFQFAQAAWYSCQGKDAGGRIWCRNHFYLHKVNAQFLACTVTFSRTMYMRGLAAELAYIERITDA